jgi:hypothetical protein
MAARRDPSAETTLSCTGTTGGQAMNEVRATGAWRAAMWGAAALLLLLPLVAMQFSDEMRWGAEDFLLFGAMLLAACGAAELVAKTRGVAYRFAAAIAIAAAFLMVWVNLAVGIIGSEGDPANLMFAGVLAVGFVGAALARLRAAGMAAALFATAIAQSLVAAISLAAGWKESAVLSALFALAWLASAGLFRRATRSVGAVARS